MQGYEKLKKFMQEPLYEHLKPNEILRPATVGFYLFCLAVIGVIGILSIFS